MELEGADRRTASANHRKEEMALVELRHPVLQRAQRSDHQDGTPDAGFPKKGEEADHLERLSESHLVRQHPVRTVLEELSHPVDALELVGKQSDRKRGTKPTCGGSESWVV